MRTKSQLARNGGRTGNVQKQNKHLLKIKCMAGHQARKLSVGTGSIFAVSEVNDNHNPKQYSNANVAA